MTAAPLAIARDLVRIPSVNPAYDPESRGEEAVAEWIAAWGRAHGMEVRLQPVFDRRPNVILTLRNGADRPHLLFNGHTDTVGVAGMTVPPFDPQVRDGRLWGRGAADMKGPLACMLAAAARLAAEPSRWRGTLTVGCVVDEEFRFRGILELMDGIERPDFAVVGEPTSLRVVRGCKGCLRFSVAVRGRAAHSAHPDRGRNAIVAMARAIVELDAFFGERLARTRHAEFGPSTGSIGLIAGGTGINIVAERCRIEVDVRLVPGQDAAATHREIEATLRSRLPAAGEYEWVFEPPMLVDPGFEIPAASPLVRHACAATATADPQVAFYSCDASKIAAAGVPCIVLGPGDIAVAHTADESIAVAELEAATDAYERLAVAVLPAGGDGEHS
jgi:acetylornithine deacetylase/succinyl-diaminopimelate desuccinylase-like protein